MRIEEFHLNLSLQDSYKVMNYICRCAMKHDIRRKIKDLDIENRTRLMQLWSWAMADYRLTPQQISDRNSEREQAIRRMLDKMSTEEWIIWFSNGNLWTIENCIGESGIRNTEIKVVLNPTNYGDDIPEELETEETF